MSEKDLLVLAASVLETEAVAIRRARSRLGKAFLAALDVLLAMHAGGRVIVMGMGKSGHIGRKLAATLASTGTPSHFVHPGEAGHGDLGMVTAGDVVIAISQSGKSDEILRILPYIKRHSIRLVAMTGSLKSALAEHADAVVDTSVDREACPLGLAPTASTTLTLALGDALAMCLLQARGFTAEQFAATHPHGTLGRRLLVSVADVMLTGTLLPMTTADTTVRDSLVSMSRGGLGFINILDSQHQMAGVFTDGDLRRVLDRDVDIKNTPIGSVMVREFASVQPSQLAVEAVQVLEQRKISALPVIDPDLGLVGAINMRLLLQAGVV